MTIETPEELDELWGQFLKSGDLAPVRRIAEVLERPDITRAKLEEWRRGKAFFPWSKRRRALISARLSERGLSPINPADQDLVLWKLMAGGFQVNDELPFRLTEEHVAHLMVKGAACWSLQSNAEQHESVGEFVGGVEALRTAPNFVR